MGLLDGLTRRSCLHLLRLAIGKTTPQWRANAFAQLYQTLRQDAWCALAAPPLAALEPISHRLIEAAWDTDREALRRLLLVLCREHLDQLDAPWMEEYEVGGFIFCGDLRQVIPFGQFFYGDFEGQVLRHLLECVKPESTVFEIGANIGAYSIPLAYKLTQGLLFAVEPNPGVAASLLTNARRNGVSERIRLWDFALGAEESSAQLSVPRSNDGAASLCSTEATSIVERIQVRVRPLTQVWDELGRPAVDLVKIDVEGFEWEVLKGGEAMLCETQPALVLELSPDKVDWSQLQSFLTSLGYHIQQIDSDGTLQSITGVPARQLDLICQVQNTARQQRGAMTDSNKDEGSRLVTSSPRA